MSSAPAPVLPWVWDVHELLPPAPCLGHVEAWRQGVGAELPQPGPQCEPLLGLWYAFRSLEEPQLCWLRIHHSLEQCEGSSTVYSKATV